MNLAINSAPVAIHSFACVTPFGLSGEELWQACMKGESFFEKGLLRVPFHIEQKVADFVLERMKAPLAMGAQNNRLLQWSLFAIGKSLENSRPLDADDGIIIATTTGLTRLWEDQLMNFYCKRDVKGYIYQPLGTFALELQHQLNLLGPIQVVASACAAGTQAIGMARRWVQSGFVKRCLVLGAEEICQLTDNGFRSLSLVNGEACFPFNESHNNICMSEAVATCLVEKSQSDAEILISGFGCASDAHSMTAPKPDGSGPLRSIQTALKEAGIPGESLDWIHAHGTGSIQNDRAEAAAIKKLALTASLTSSKAVHGHSLAASGILETILCYTALKKQIVLPAWGAEPCHFNINIQARVENKNLNHILKNTLGFGGVNASLILSRSEVFHA